MCVAAFVAKPTLTSLSEERADGGLEEPVRCPQFIGGVRERAILAVTLTVLQQAGTP